MPAPSAIAAISRCAARSSSQALLIWGSFAEYVGIHQADLNLVALPESMDFATAASLGCRFATSFRAVVDQGKVSAGRMGRGSRLRRRRPVCRDDRPSHWRERDRHRYFPGANSTWHARSALSPRSMPSAWRTSPKPCWKSLRAVPTYRWTHWATQPPASTPSTTCAVAASTFRWG